MVVRALLIDRAIMKHNLEEIIFFRTCWRKFIGVIVTLGSVKGCDSFTPCLLRWWSETRNLHFMVNCCNCGWFLRKARVRFYGDGNSKSLLSSGVQKYTLNININQHKLIKKKEVFCSREGYITLFGVLNQCYQDYSSFLFSFLFFLSFSISQTSPYLSLFFFFFMSNRSYFPNRVLCFLRKLLQLGK